MDSTSVGTSSLRTNVEIVAVGLGALMAALTQTLVIPVLPVISRSIGASTTEAQWLLTSTLLVAAVSVPIIGRFADMLGRRLLLLICLAGLTVGSVVDALTSDVTVMIVGRRSPASRPPRSHSVSACWPACCRRSARRPRPA